MARFVTLHLHPTGLEVHLAVAHVTAVSQEVRNTRANMGTPAQYAPSGVTIVAIGPGEEHAYRVQEPAHEVVALLQGDRDRA